MLASSGEMTDPCPVPLSVPEPAPPSRMPAFSYFWIRRMMRRSPIRCSRKRISHCWLISSKNDRMSASRMKLTLLLCIPTQSASSASCAPRPGRNPYENPRKSSSWIAFSSATTARWTILSSRAATPSGPGRASRRLDTCALGGRAGGRTLPAIRLGNVDSPRRQCPIRSPLDPIMQVLDIAFEVRLVGLPRQPIHAGGCVLLKFEERLLQEFGVDVVEERSEPLLPPFACDFPYAVQRL